MFTNGTGYQFHGGVFYNVAGDVNLQHHHLTVEDRRLELPACQPPTLGLRDVEPPMIQAGAIDDRTAESEHELAGVVRNSRHGVAAATTPYDATSRFRRANPLNHVANAQFAVSSSLNTSSGVSVNVPSAAARFESSLDYPPPSSSSPSPHSLGLPMLNPPSHSSASHPRPHFETDHRRAIGPGSGAASLDDDRLDEGHLTQCREASRLLPMPSTQGATFFSANNVNTAGNIIHNHRHGETGIHILHRAVALEALYDSADSFPQPKCHPETRTKLLDDLYQWANQDDPSHPICWLHGPAGAGKSAIMQTLCDELQSTSRLGGAFFFKRGHATRGNAKVLFATLAYQVALNNHELNPLISQIVEHDPSIVGRSMNILLHQLIVEPCKSPRDSAPILFIDGLDECDTHDSQVEVLHLIGRVVRQHPNIFRIIIASRPEAHICDTLEEPSFTDILSSVNIEQSFDDVRIFLRDKFARIHREHKHTMEDVPTPWPSAEILERLVQKSSGYFVYASTVVKFVGDKNFHPIERLAAVHNLSQTHSEAPFASLDQLYFRILSGVPGRFRATLGDILQSVIVCGAKRLRSHDIEKLLDLPSGIVHLTLRSLRSVVDVDGICLYHASFLDFLQDPQRSSIFHLTLDNCMNVTRAIIKTLSGDSHSVIPLGLNLADLAKCLGSVPPSAELAPLFRTINHVFVLSESLPSQMENVQHVLLWLMGVQPIPEDLIQSWEAYQFLGVWEHSFWMFKIHNGPDFLPHVLQTGVWCRFSSISLEDCLQFVVQSPEFVRIFLACLLHMHHFDYFASQKISMIHYTRLLLDLSWDPIVAAFSALNSIIGRGSGDQIFTGTLDIIRLSLTLYPCNVSLLTSELAQGALRLIQRIGSGDLSLDSICEDLLHLRWGQLIKSSPQSPELLRDLHEFVLPCQWGSFRLGLEDGYYIQPAEFTNTLHWIEQLPDPPVDLIERWKGYLNQSGDTSSVWWYRTLSDLEVQCSLMRISSQANTPMGDNSEQEDS